MQELTPGQSIAQRFNLTRRLEPEPGCERWLAFDEARESAVVLRFPDGLAHADVSPEAHRELKRISRLVHPNIIPFLGLFEHEGRAVCAHAHAEGSDLREWSGKDYKEALAAVLPALDAIAYLHDLGVAHGGLDARALRLTHDGIALLDGAGVAVVSAPRAEPPHIRGDLQSLGRLLAGLAGARSGIPLPEALTDLFAALQSSDREAPDIHSTRRQIARTLELDEQPRIQAKPAGGANAGPISARARTAAGPGGKAGSHRTTRASVPIMIAAPALLAILALAILVLVYLPRPVVQAPSETNAGARPGAPARSSQQQPAQPAVAPFAAAETAKLRQDAQDAAMALLRSLVALEERHAEVWAAEAFSAARQAGEEGDAIYRRQEFAAALARYRQGLAQAESLIAKSGEVLSAALAEGAAALQAGDAESARQQFELAVLIDSEHPGAQSGLERAAALGEVLDLMAAGAQLEQSGQLSEARETYRKATLIDPEFAPAAEALSRASGKLGSQRYQQLMSRGFAQLQQENIAEARVAFEQAAKMRPGEAGPRDALEQLDLRRRNREIGDRRAAAEAAERDEQWRRAEAEYQAALDADNTLVFARDGLVRAQQRAKLDERMALLINEPLRMFSNDVYNEARAMLAQARLIDDAGPRLREQINALAGHIELARKPVAVTVRSDGQTAVTIYKIGDLGRFQEKTIGLIPGRYTAVGARPGYRDVRREFVVQAGARTPQLSVICEEPV